MKLRALFGWGIVIYALLSLVWSFLEEYGWTAGAWPLLAEIATLFIVCVWAGSALKFKTWKDILPYSIGWAGIAAILDALSTVPITGWSYFSEPSVWGGYALIALVPLLSTLFLRRYAAHAAWEA